MAILIQIFFPILYIVIGLSIVDITDYTVVQDEPYNITANTYKETYSKEGMNIYSYINNTGGEIQDFVAGMSSSGDLLQLKAGTEFKDLLASQQMAVVDFKSKNDMTILFNFTALQSIPVSINSLTNMYAAAYGLGGNVSVVSQPLAAEALSGFDYAAFAGVMFIGFTYLMLPMGLAMELVEDRELKCKNQLRVNGFGFGLYFSVHFVLMAVLMLIMILILLVLTFVSDHKLRK